jgi:hypothetical protein
MSSVTVGGKSWAGFDAATETVTFSAEQLGSAAITDGLHTIVATFGGAASTPLCRARVSRRTNV